MLSSIAHVVSVRSQLGLDHQWGLYVYRTTFEDEEIWERYVKYVHNAVNAGVLGYYWRVDPALVVRVQSSFQLIIKEDESLEGLTYHQVRETFGPWIASGGAEEDQWLGSGMYDWYFLYVDQVILEKFRQIDDARQEGPPDYIAEQVPLIVVEAYPLRWGPEPDDEVDSKFEGDPAEEDAGKDWQYVSAYHLLEFIDMHRGDGDAWYTFFKHPPEVWDTS
ncbi:hypothetical protein F5Y10DRAFT_266971 [Nemania abortiva]|nr:hypothetical protein F5Y10DRAFT_266971 [Nemania abortiva]